MELTDVAPVEAWKELELEITRAYGLNGSVFDSEGKRITDAVNWTNQLCPVVKANEKGQTFICSLAHQNISAQARQTKKPILEECDAGLIKIVAPIFVDDEFLGVVGGCGLLSKDGEVNTFLINKTTGIDEKKLEGLSQNIGVLTDSQISNLFLFLTGSIEKLLDKS